MRLNFGLVFSHTQSFVTFMLTEESVKFTAAAQMQRSVHKRGRFLDNNVVKCKRQKDPYCL
jgi:hypothetical protein